MYFTNNLKFSLRKLVFIPRIILFMFMNVTLINILIGNFYENNIINVIQYLIALPTMLFYAFLMISLSFPIIYGLIDILFYFKYEYTWEEIKSYYFLVFKSFFGWFLKR